MKIAIVYYSQHHGNTKKLLDAISELGDVTLIDATQIKCADLSDYDMVGFASGIYFQKFHKTVIEFASCNLPEDKSVFLIYTCGFKRPVYTKCMKEVIRQKRAKLIGSYGCLGYDTFGPFKLVGGIAKGRPNVYDVQRAVAFFEKMRS